MSLKFPLPLPDLWIRALDPTEIAYTIAFTKGVSDKRVSESPLDADLIEKLESNFIEPSDDRNTRYYGLGILQIDDDYDMASLWFEVSPEYSTSGSFRSGGYLEPDEYPEDVLDDFTVSEVMVNSGTEERSLDLSQNFGIYPDFNFKDFNELLNSYILSTASYDETDMGYQEVPHFPASIIKKIEDFVKSESFVSLVIKNIKNIEPEDLLNAVEFYNLDMKQYRGRIAGMKFGL